MNGFIPLNKPSGISSQQAVSRVKKILGINKAGHTGTLDPAAEGLLLIAVGKATRLCEYLLNSTKGYRAVVRFGIATSTYDSEGQHVSVREDFLISTADVESALTQFRGEIWQKPPAASALKVDGKRAYQLFRAGVEPNLPPRQIQIYSLSLAKAPQRVEPSNPDIILDIECSKGTYVRSLAHDLGTVLFCPAHLFSLTRTKVGPVHIQQAVDFAALEQYGSNCLLDMAVAVDNLPRIELSTQQLMRFFNGQEITISHNITGRAAVFCLDELVGIGTAERDRLEPQKVLVSEQTHGHLF